MSEALLACPRCEEFERITIQYIPFYSYRHIVAIRCLTCDFFVAMAQDGKTQEGTGDAITLWNAQPRIKK